jgi:hypothetical protein
VKPGPTALTVMPNSPSSSASTLVSWTTPAFGGAVGATFVAGVCGGGGGDVDDAASLPLLDHPAASGSATEKLALEVHAQNRVPVLFTHINDATVEPEARYVYQCVQFAVGVCCGCDHGVDLRAFGHVDLGCPGRTTGSRDLSRNGLGPIQVHVGNGDRRAVSRQRQSDFPPDAGSGAGDYCRLAGKVRVHVQLQVAGWWPIGRVGRPRLARSQLLMFP